MALRNSQVGQPVRFQRFGKATDGAIIAIDSQGLRTVATDDGHEFKTPAELDASDADPSVKAIEDLEPGDTVVLFNGTRRTVDVVVPVGTPTRYRVTFREDDKPLTIFREQTGTPGSLYRVVSPSGPAGE